MLSEPILASFTWSAKRIGNLGYVLEERPDGSRHEFGPMPSHVVPSFIHARRIVIGERLRFKGFIKNDDDLVVDWSFLDDKS